MGLDDYKACVPLPDGNILCFNARTRQLEIITIHAKPADLESISKDMLVKLKAKLDASNKKS